MIVKPKRNTIINFHCKDTKCMVSLTPQQKYKAHISMEKYQVELVHHNFYITLPYDEYIKYFREESEKGST